MGVEITARPQPKSLRVKAAHPGVAFIVRRNARAVARVTSTFPCWCSACSARW